jgi:hypothetical protein
MFLIWECFALTSQRRDKLSMKAQRVEHLRCEMVVGSIKNIGANAQPLQVCVYRDLRTRINYDIKEMGRKASHFFMRGAFDAIAMSVAKLSLNRHIWAASSKSFLLSHCCQPKLVDLLHGDRPSPH